MERYFPHEQLDVYGVALKFAAMGESLLSAWPASWAVYDQFSRALESIVINLAKAARLRATDCGVYSLECSLGSVLECAACLDVAVFRNLVDASRRDSAKTLLQQIARMEVGLRESWKQGIREGSTPISTDAKRFFPHESLEVYQRSLQLHESLNVMWSEDRIRCRHVRRVDELSTSLTLNIAEGNGRFSQLDHSKFLDVAEDSGTKLAAYLDLAVPLAQANVSQVKSHLREVMAMLSGLQNYLKKQSP